MTKAESGTGLSRPEIHIPVPPAGLAILPVIGPSFIWCAEYIGSGEVILATRTGAILGPAILWAIVTGIFLKYWIGLSGARYTVCTGEGMMDMFARIPGPRNWAVWVVLVAQFASATVAIGSLASAAGVFLHSLIPLSSTLCGWLVTLVCLLIAWFTLFHRPCSAGLGKIFGRNERQCLARNPAPDRLGGRRIRQPGLVHLLGAGRRLRSCHGKIVRSTGRHFVFETHGQRDRK